MCWCGVTVWEGPCGHSSGAVMLEVKLSMVTAGLRYFSSVSGIRQHARWMGLGPQGKGGVAHWDSRHVWQELKERPKKLEHSLSPNCEYTEAWERSVSAGFLESKSKASHSEQDLETGPGSWGDERISKGMDCICQPATVGLKTPYYGIPIALCTLPFVCLCLPKDFPCVQCSLLKVLAHLRCAGRSQEELSCLHWYLSILEAPRRGQKSPSSP